MTPLLRVYSCRVWNARLTHCSRNRHDTQTQSALRHLHRAVLNVDVGLHLQQASTARQAECTGAVVCSTGAVPFSFPPFYPSSLTERHTRFTLPYPSLTPSIARGDVADATSEFRRVPIWSCVFPTRRFFAKNFKGCISPPPPLSWGDEYWEGGFPQNFAMRIFDKKSLI